MDITLGDPDTDSLSTVTCNRSCAYAKTLTWSWGDGQRIDVVGVWIGEIMERSVQSQCGDGWVLYVDRGGPASGSGDDGEVEGSGLDEAEVLGVASRNILEALCRAVGISGGEGHCVVVEVHLRSRVINDQHVDGILGGCNFVVELGAGTTALSNGAYRSTQSVCCHRPVIDDWVQVVSRWCVGSGREHRDVVLVVSTVEVWCTLRVGSGSGGLGSHVSTVVRGNWEGVD